MPRRRRTAAVLIGFEIKDVNSDWVTYRPTVNDWIDLDNVETVVLVEGVSDQRAVEALAERSGHDLAADAIVVLPMGGATNIGRYLAELGPRGRNLRLAGLCDEAEVRFFRRALQPAGVSGRDEVIPGPAHEPGLTASIRQPSETTSEYRDLAAHHFYVCRSDLEDELIRALGVPAVEQILDAHGDLRSFRTFQQQPDQHGKSDDARLRRFMGTRGGRKIEYAALLAQALPRGRAPEPLARLMASI